MLNIENAEFYKSWLKNIIEFVLLSFASHNKKRNSQQLIVEPSTCFFRKYSPLRKHELKPVTKVGIMLDGHFDNTKQD